MVQGRSESGSEGEAARVAWQVRLLPLMGAMLLLAALFFAVVSVVELRALYSELRQKDFDLAAVVPDFAPASGNLDANSSEARTRDLPFRVRAALEANALERRYHQASAAMLARVWTRQLGFVTGMLLALVGAAFVLGRLNEPATTLTGEGQGFKGSLQTSSPGIVLAVLGTVLMGITIAVPFEVETKDANLYLGSSPGLDERDIDLGRPDNRVLETLGAGGGDVPAVTEQGLEDEKEIFGDAVPDPAETSDGAPPTQRRDQP